MNIPQTSESEDGEYLSRMKLGPWHPPEVLPVHEGVYEVDQEDQDGRAFSYWNGTHWSYIAWEKPSGGLQGAWLQALRFYKNGSIRPNLFGWRGLTPS